MVRQGYKETEVGVIPEDWEVVPLLEKADLINGLTYTPADIRDYGLLVMRSSNVRNGRFSFTDNVYVDCAVSEERLIKKNDILICVRNGSAALIGKCAKADKDYNVTFGAFMAVLRGTNNDYIFQLLLQGTIQKHISKNSDSTINQITNGDFKQIKIAFPKEESERLRIISALSDTDHLISDLEKLIAKKKAVKQGAMRKLLSGERRLPGFDGEWVQTLLKDVLKIYSGYVFKSSTYDNTTGIYNVVTIANVQQGQLDISECNKIAELPSDIQRYQLLDIGDMLISLTGNVGRVCFVDKEKCLLNQRVGKVAVFENHNKEFVYHVLSTSDFLNEMILSAKGGAQPNLSAVDIYNYSFACPPTIEEENAISALLNDMQSEIDSLENRLVKYNEIKSGMMSDLLTGRIRLTDREEA